MGKRIKIERQRLKKITNGVKIPDLIRMFPPAFPFIQKDNATSKGRSGVKGEREFYDMLNKFTKINEDWFVIHDIGKVVKTFIAEKFDEFLKEAQKRAAHADGIEKINGYDPDFVVMNKKIWNIFN